MKKRYTLLLLLFCTLSLLNGQEVRLEIAPDLKVSPGSGFTEEDTKKQILNGLQEILDEYAEAATLKDKNRGLVTGESIERFHALFSPTAKIVDDFREYPSEEIPYNDYSSRVYSLMESEGVQVSIEEAVLKEVIDDPAGFYVLVMEVEKSIFNQLNSSGRVEDNTSGRYYTQEFRLDIPKVNLDQIKITGIKGGGDVLLPADYYRYISFSARGVLASTNLTTVSSWATNHPNASLSGQAGVGYSLGVEWATNQFINPAKASNKKLGFSIGIRYARQPINTNLSNFSLLPFDTAVVDTGGMILTQPYRRLVSEVRGEEEINISLLEIPIGLSYELVEQKTFRLLLNARVVPSLIIAGSGRFEGSGTYDGVFLREMPNGSLEPLEFRLLEMQAIDRSQIDDNEEGFGLYDVGESQSINEEADLNLNSFTLGLQLEPVAYFDFGDYNPVWGIMAGLSLNYQLNSFLEHDATGDEMLRYSNDYNGSILQRYAESASVFSIGFRLGVYHKLVTEP